MSIESASLEQLRVHVEYMKEMVKALHQRLDDMPSAKQLAALEERIEALQAEQHKQSELMSTLVNLERFAKWIGGIAAAVVSVWALFRLFKG